MLTTVILVFLIIAAYAIVYWGVTRLTLPPNVGTVLVVLLGLVAIAFIYNVVFEHGTWLHFR